MAAVAGSASAVDAQEALDRALEAIDGLRNRLFYYGGILDSLGFGEEMAQLEQERTDIKRPSPWRRVEIGRPTAARGWAWASGIYLTLNAFSMRVPGPATWLHIAPHVMLFHHVATLVRLL